MALRLEPSNAHHATLTSCGAAARSQHCLGSHTTRACAAPTLNICRVEHLPTLGSTGPHCRSQMTTASSLPQPAVHPEGFKPPAFRPTIGAPPASSLNSIPTGWARASLLRQRQPCSTARRASGVVSSSRAMKHSCRAPVRASRPPPLLLVLLLQPLLLLSVRAVAASPLRAVAAKPLRQVDATPLREVDAKPLRQVDTRPLRVVDARPVPAVAAKPLTSQYPRHSGPTTSPESP